MLAFTFSLMGIPKNIYGFSGENNTDQAPSPESGIEVELEYLSPWEDARNIDTLSFNILKGSSVNDRMSFYKGITITRAYGNITHLGEVLNSSAFGFGPDFMLRYQLKQWNQATLSLDMSGSLIIYSDNFPAGGDVYNFMWRIGPRFICPLGNNFSLNVGYILMHVSNGQWSDNEETSHNPAYNASGFSFCISTSLN